MEAPLPVESVLKFNQYSKSDIEKGLAQPPELFSSVTVRSFLGNYKPLDGDMDDEYRLEGECTKYEYPLRYSMIRNWAWKKSKYVSLLEGKDDGEDSNGGLEKTLKRIRKEVDDVLTDTAYMAGTSETLAATLNSQRELCNARVQTLSKMNDAFSEFTDKTPGLRMIVEEEKKKKREEENKRREEVKIRHEETKLLSKMTHAEKNQYDERKRQEAKEKHDREREERAARAERAEGSRGTKRRKESAGGGDVSEIEDGASRDGTKTARKIKAEIKTAVERLCDDSLAPLIQEYKHISNELNTSDDEDFDTHRPARNVPVDISDANRNYADFLEEFVRVIRSLSGQVFSEKYTRIIAFITQEITRQKRQIEPPARSDTMNNYATDVIKEMHPEYRTMKKAIAEKTRVKDEIIGLLGEQITEDDLKEFDDVEHDEKCLTQTIPNRLREKYDGRNNVVEKWNELIEKTEKKWKTLLNVLYKCQKEIRGRDRELASILHIILAFSNNYSIAQKSYLNFALLGPAGTGKTTLAKAIGKLFAASGILMNGNFKEIIRSNLIGQYVGETTQKTSSELEMGRENVLFLDEVYALTPCETRSDKIKNPGDQCPVCTKWDSYGVESLNAIVPFLSSNQGLVVMVIAGYTEDTICTFFQANEGIPRRFPYVYILKALDTEQLINVFIDKLSKMNPKVNKLTNRSKKLLYSLIDEYRNEYFPNGSGDIENLAKYVADRLALLDKSEASYADLHEQNAVNTCVLGKALEHYLWNSHDVRFNCGENCKCNDRENNYASDIDKLNDNPNLLTLSARADKIKKATVNQRRLEDLLSIFKQQLKEMEFEKDKNTEYWKKIEFVESNIEASTKELEKIDRNLDKLWSFIPQPETEEDKQIYSDLLTLRSGNRSLEEAEHKSRYENMINSSIARTYSHARNNPKKQALKRMRRDDETDISERMHRPGDETETDEELSAVRRDTLNRLHSGRRTTSDSRKK